MNGMNLIYNPDHQQVLEHHKELLKKAEQSRLLPTETATPKYPHISIRKWLQHWLSDRHTGKIVQITTQSPSSHT